jgi:hypothetical protein
VFRQFLDEPLEVPENLAAKVRVIRAACVEPAHLRERAKRVIQSGLFPGDIQDFPQPTNADILIGWLIQPLMYAPHVRQSFFTPERAEFVQFHFHPVGDA